jgi:hypothetical protein
MESDPAMPIPFLNLEYFFRLIYGSQLSVSTGTAPTTPRVSFLDTFYAWFGDAWGMLGLASFLFTLLAFGLIIYATVRMAQIKHREDVEKYSTLQPDVAEKAKDHSRWAHIRSLIESPSESDWRQAIIEADIMLEEVLNQAGYFGVTVGDRLKLARFNSLDDAWEAHKIRNEIAHRGSAYHLDDKIAYRTVQKYERVFKEFGEI